jgi:hypothetical protein
MALNPICIYYTSKSSTFSQTMSESEAHCGPSERVSKKASLLAYPANAVRIIYMYNEKFSGG